MLREESPTLVPQAPKLGWDQNVRDTQLVKEATWAITGPLPCGLLWKLCVCVCVFNLDLVSTIETGLFKVRFY